MWNIKVSDQSRLELKSSGLRYSRHLYPGDVTECNVMLCNLMLPITYKTAWFYNPKDHNVDIKLLLVSVLKEVH
jgi:hypothetical protein